MAYRLEQRESAAEGIRRIACEQLDKAVEKIENSEIDRHETVHQVRKRCKKIRGLVRLVRPSLGKACLEENAWYRDSARTLSDVRDAQALVECCRDLLDHYAETFRAGTFAELRQKLILHRDRSAATERDVEERLGTFSDRMNQGRARVKDWPLDDEGFDLLEGGLTKTYRRGRRAMAVAGESATVEVFHEWRKRVKDHWYHARLLKNIWAGLIPVYCDELKNLSDYLGDDHDLAVL